MNDMVTNRKMRLQSMPESSMRTPAANLRRRVWLTLAMVSAMAGTACTATTAVVRRLTCSTTLIQQAPSPDGARIASLYSANCGGAMTRFEGLVFLSDRSETVNPLDFEHAQGILYPFSPDTSLTWRDDQHLTVRCISCFDRQFKKRDAMWKEVQLLYEGREDKPVATLR
jgi:hypothetical protein